MNIIYTTKIYLPHIGGVEIYIKKLADYFSAKGHSITVITAGEEISHLQTEYDGNIKILRIPAKSISGIYFLKHLKDLQIIKQELASANIVHINDCKFLFSFFVRQKNRFHYKLFCSSHGWLFHTKNHSLLKKIYFKQIVVKNAYNFDHIICVSEQDKNIAIHYGIKDTCVITPGADCNKYANLPKKTTFENTFFYWGRISQNTGILEALKKLSTLTNPYNFIIAGKCEDSDYMKQLQDFIENHKMTEKIHFVGLLSDVQIRDYIQNSDFILMPSLHEGFGMTLVECLLSERAIIANTNESFCTILNQTDAKGFLFNFEDESSDFAMKLQELKCKKVVPKHVEQFSVETVLKKIEKLYNQEKI